jgi:hypothetical protein
MTSKKIILGVVIATAITFSALALVSKSEKKSVSKPIMNKQANEGFAVVELFTSEGCSSCPSADAAVERLLQKNIEHVYILAYHVDYWDRLGWKDPFSKKEYSQRQSAYADKFGKVSVYTPQVIVNGATEFVGSDESKLGKAVGNGLEKTPANNFEITVKQNDNAVVVNYNIKESSNLLLNVALVQPEATTVVKRGENGGRTLHHVNIVRELNTTNATRNGTVTLKIPDSESKTPFKVIAFTQSSKDLHVLNAVEEAL